MPELPEVETVRRDVHALLVGRVIDHVEATGQRTVRRSSADAVVWGSLGRTIVGTGRHGKWLWLDLEPAGKLYVHLRMSGQLLWSASAAARPRHTHMVLRSGSHELRFVDPRTFGEVVVLSGSEILADITRQGPDVLELPPNQWGSLFNTRRAVKTVLTDQRSLAGIGNIYADEIVHRAAIRPQRPSDTLSKPARVRLGEAAHAVLSAAIVARGSSLSDLQYVDLTGRPGSFQAEHRVHARRGCLSCGGEVTRMVLAGRGTYFCRRCQR